MEVNIGWYIIEGRERKHIAVTHLIQIWRKKSCFIWSEETLETDQHQTLLCQPALKLNILIQMVQFILKLEESKS